MKTFTKKVKYHRWSYLDRPMTIEMPIDSNNIRFHGAIRVHYSHEKYNMRAISRIQKILNQKLYNYLTEIGGDTGNYVLVIDAPETPKGEKIFVELNINLKRRSNLRKIDDLRDMCEGYITEMKLRLEKELSFSD